MISIAHAIATLTHLLLLLIRCLGTFNPEEEKTKSLVSAFFPFHSPFLYNGDKWVSLIYAGVTSS